MVSFDVESLFANIPLEECINLAIEYIRKGNPDLKLSPTELKTLFNFATAETHFLFKSLLTPWPPDVQPSYTVYWVQSSISASLFLFLVISRSFNSFFAQLIIPPAYLIMGRIKTQMYYARSTQVLVP